MGKLSLGSYTRLNIQRAVHQGKNLVVLACIALFFIEYFGGIRGNLNELGMTMGVHELFPAVMNTDYTAFVVWMGYILVVCDLPYDETGFELYLMRTSKRGWMAGQMLYTLIATVIYFGYLQMLLFLQLVPNITMQQGWSDGFMVLVSNPFSLGITQRFTYALSIMREHTSYLIYIKQILLCVLAGSAISSLIMVFNMFWKNGVGIAVGGAMIALDYLVSTVINGRYNLYYVSPLTMTRISCLSHNTTNSMLPSVGYAASVFFGMIVCLGSCMLIGVKSYEFKEGGGK